MVVEHSPANCFRKNDKEISLLFDSNVNVSIMNNDIALFKKMNNDIAMFSQGFM